MENKIISVDFDGTLCENNWPEIGEANKEMITYLKGRKANGDKLILWTCRVDDMLKNAIDWSAEQGLIFDAINENLPEMVAFFGTNTRKVFADEYIDDRNAWLPSKEVANILYLCDGKRCGDPCPLAECKHTSDISHAKNFVKGDYDSYWEKENRSGQISEVMSQSDRMELWGRLIDVVEDWLAEKGITEEDIPNEERESVEDAAIIFGDDYDYFADRFSKVRGISRDCIGGNDESK